MLLIALPWAGLPDSLNTLSDLATQLQTLIAAAIAHPIRAITLFAVSIGLLQIAIDLVKRALKAAITLTLKLPLNLSQWLWQKATAPSREAQQVQIDQLITRLDTLHQEQVHTIAKLKDLLSSQPAVNPLKSLPDERVQPQRELASPPNVDSTASQAPSEA